MPVEYSGIVAEHMATRTAAGLFDVSHMGEIEVRGPHALALVQHVTCNDASKLVVGQAHYSGLMNEKGTFVDDLLVHKISDTHYFLCVNAGNQDQDFEHIRAHNVVRAEIEKIVLAARNESSDSATEAGYVLLQLRRQGGRQFLFRMWRPFDSCGQCAGESPAAAAAGPAGLA